MAKAAQQSETISIFSGFDLPSSNYFRLPKNWTDITAQMNSLGELKVVEYLLRHTWGFQEYGIKKRITIDEFMQGRKRRDGTRMDRGTGLSEQGVRNALDLAKAHGFIEEEIDDHDKARIKKYYSIKMKLSHPLEPSTDFDEEDTFVDNSRHESEVDPKSFGPGVKSFDPATQDRGQTFGPRTEIDTLDRYSKIDTSSAKMLITDEIHTTNAVTMIEDVVRKVAAEFNDQAPVGVSVKRAHNDFVKAQVSIETFMELAEVARAETKRRASHIHKHTRTLFDEQGGMALRGEKTKMAYWFSVLERLLGLRVGKSEDNAKAEHNDTQATKKLHKSIR